MENPYVRGKYHQSGGFYMAILGLPECFSSISVRKDSIADVHGQPFQAAHLASRGEELQQGAG